MSQIHIVTECWVPGHPKTKGSLRHRGHGQLEESVGGSKMWRMLMAQTIREDRAVRGLTIPAVGPVAVRIAYWLDPPMRPGEEWPATPIWPGAGDGDKLQRNTLDALKDAGAYQDDNQVCRFIVDKLTMPIPTHDGPGMRLQCWEMQWWEIRYQRDQARGEWVAGVPL